MNIKKFKEITAKLEDAGKSFVIMVEDGNGGYYYSFDSVGDIGLDGMMATQILEDSEFATIVTDAIDLAAGEINKAEKATKELLNEFYNNNKN